jgi:predicted nucleotidyltransferase
MVTAPTLEQLRGRRDDILRAAAAHSADNVRVFGSVARNQARPDSDVDLVVDLDPAQRGFAAFAALRELSADLERLLGVHVDVVRISVPSSRAAAILREAVPL